MLSKLLDELGNQLTTGLFTYSAVVVDNDFRQSAKATVEHHRRRSALKIDYHVEPDQNISQARNKAIDNAVGNLIAFIDDDEFPEPNWLLELFSTCMKYDVDGVLGPVVPHFPKEPPRWIKDGKICDRPTYPTGTAMHWDHMRTGNVLFRQRLLQDPTHRFRREYGRSGGEDGDFFCRVCEDGARFVWCHDAAVYETISDDRLEASYYLKRAMRIGGLNGERARMDPMRMIKRLPKNWAWATGLLLAPLTVFTKKHIRMKVLMKAAYEVGWAFGLFGRVFFRVRED